MFINQSPLLLPLALSSRGPLVLPFVLFLPCYSVCPLSPYLTLHVLLPLFIPVPAKFDAKDKQENLTVNNASRVQLVCTAFGDQPINIQWKRRVYYHSHRIASSSSAINSLDLNRNSDSVEETHLPIVPASLDSRLTIQDTSTVSSVTSRLTIDPCRRDDSTLFTCIASNSYGSDVKRISVEVQETPEPPVKVTVEYKTSRSIALTWIQGYTGNGEDTRKQVHRYISRSPADT